MWLLRQSATFAEMPFIWTSRERIVVDCPAVADTLWLPQALPQRCKNLADHAEFLRSATLRRLSSSSPSVGLSVLTHAWSRVADA
jgi:hypothetical protein